MKLTDFGQVILNEQDILDGLYSGKINVDDTILLEDSVECRKFLETAQQNFERLEEYQIFVESGITQEEFDKTNQDNWFMPEEYRLYDIVDWLYCQCRTPEEKERVTQELKLYAQHNMIYLLKYLKYLVDTMRKEKIVWGVGRGSSVASYCLYLLGVHKVNSIKYGLDINEFLK
jgi:DNA polymerase III alpha subunit